MGSSGSKAAQGGVRKFPSKPAARAAARAPGSAPRVVARQLPPKASTAKDEATRADSTKPESPDMVSAAFAERLRKMGVVQPNPTYSPSSTAVPFPDVPDQYPPAPNYPPATSNVTLGVLEARRQLQERADLELENRGKSTDRGRELLDIETIRKILVLRQRGERSADIEARLRLRSGVVDRLGPLGLVTALATQAA